MLAAQKVMIATLLIANGAEQSDISEFIEALEVDLRNEDRVAKAVFDDLMSKMNGDLPKGPAGDIIRLMKAKIDFDKNQKRFGIAVTGLKKALSILENSPRNNLAAKVLISKVLEISRVSREG